MSNVAGSIESPPASISRAMSAFVKETACTILEPSSFQEAHLNSVSNDVLLKSLNNLIMKLQGIVKDIKYELSLGSASSEDQKNTTDENTINTKLTSNEWKNYIDSDTQDMDQGEVSNLLDTDSTNTMKPSRVGKSTELPSPEAPTCSFYVDPSLIQIKASNSEIQRRILAFIDQKRTAVDETNKREFCSSLYSSSDQMFSCARTDATNIPRVSGKSHIKVSRVVNIHGPQTHIPPSPIKPPPCIKTEDDGIAERLTNMEKHLHLEASTQDRKSLFSRLKVLEERLLYLEGLSPEYFHHMSFPRKRHKPSYSIDRDSRRKDMSITEMDDRIKALKRSLQVKSEIM
ncbi:hypothetical protein ScPMuIL_013764 [Solemya velum]